MAAKRLQALSQQLAEGIPDAGTFEGIPRIRQVAGDSLGPYVIHVLENKSTANSNNRRMKDKVAIVTGTTLHPSTG